MSAPLDPNEALAYAESEREHFARVARETFQELKAITAERDGYAMQLRELDTRYELALTDAAVAVEAHRDPNPINGSMANHTLDKVLRDLDALAFSTKPSEAAAELRRTLQERRDAAYRRLHGIA